MKSVSTRLSPVFAQGTSGQVAERVLGWTRDTKAPASATRHPEQPELLRALRRDTNPFSQRCALPTATELPFTARWGSAGPPTIRGAGTRSASRGLLPPLRPVAGGASAAWGPLTVSGRAGRARTDTENRTRLRAGGPKAALPAPARPPSRERGPALPGESRAPPQASTWLGRTGRPRPRRAAPLRAVAHSSRSGLSSSARSAHCPRPWRGTTSPSMLRADAARPRSESRLSPGPAGAAAVLGTRSFPEPHLPFETDLASQDVRTERRQDSTDAGERGPAGREAKGRTGAVLLAKAVPLVPASAGRLKCL